MRLARCVTAISIGVAAGLATAYPTDQYERTGIRRLERTRALQERVLPPGAVLPASEVAPSGIDATQLPPPDPQWSAQIARLLGDDADKYSVALLDLSDPADLHYAAHRADERANVGSVGKLLVLLAWMRKLADWYPDDVAARERVLRDTRVIADRYIDHDSHKVPITQSTPAAVRWRPLRHGDEGSLWEFMDWMLSASSNAAASMVMQQLAAAELFGPGFASGDEPVAARLSALTPARRGEAMLAAMLRPLADAGFDPERTRQASLFTHTAKQLMPSGLSSYATANDLMRLLLLIEAGRFVDDWSSGEAKRLLYLTQKRIRYASHPVLDPAAVYFKSGSLYMCRPEPGFVCGKYRGNKVNRLASVALVEYPAHSPQLRYAVAVMSNVLRKNSAVAHQTLALRIHRLVEARHARSTMAPDDRALPPAKASDAEGQGPDDE